MLWVGESSRGVEGVSDSNWGIFVIPKVRGRQPTRNSQVKNDVPHAGLSRALERFVVEFKLGILWGEFFGDRANAVWGVSRIRSNQLSLSVESDGQGL